MAAKLNLSVFNSVEIRDIDISTTKSHLKASSVGFQPKGTYPCSENGERPGIWFEPGSKYDNIKPPPQNSHQFTTVT